MAQDPSRDCFARPDEQPSPIYPINITTDPMKTAIKILLIVLALALVLGAARAVEREGRALSLRRFADALALPMRDLLRVAAILEGKQILLRVAEGSPPVVTGCVLARCATRLTVADVINACLDDSDGEALLARASDTPLQAPLVAIESRFSALLSGQFDMTVDQALRMAETQEAAHAP